METEINVSHRVVIITGVLGGIGSEVAKKFKANGWYVVGIDLYGSHNIDMHHNMEHICDEEHSVDLSMSDLTTEFDEILDNLPRLDAIIHVAAKQVCGSVITSDINQWDQIMNVNVKSVYLLSRLAYQLLKASKGSIVVVSSIHAFQSSKSISMYAISKSALLGVVRNLAIEWAEDGIRVNAIAPGGVQTKMLLDGLTRSGIPAKQALERFANRHLTKRILQPVEIANTIYFLATSESSAITGQTIIADGGASILLSTEVD